MVKFFIVLCCLLSTFNSWSSGCLDERDSAAVLSQISIVQSSHGSGLIESEKWKSIEGWDNCDSSDLIYKVVESIVGLKNLPALNSERDEFNNALLKGSPYSFFIERVGVIRIDNNPTSKECAADNIFTLAFVNDSFSSTMTICRSAFESSDIELYGILIHEAQHLFPRGQLEVQRELSAQLGNKTSSSHILCNSGYFKGTYSCDPNSQEVGSYSIEAEFYIRVARTKGFSDKVRQQAHGLYVETLLGHFSEIPGGQKGLLLLSDEDELIFYNPNDDSSSTVVEHIPNDSIIADRFLPSFFYKEKVKVESPSFYSADDFIATSGLLAQKFRELPKEKAVKLVDVMYGHRNQCMLFSDSIACLAATDQLISIDLPAHIKPVQLSFFKGITELDLFFISSEDGRTYQFTIPADEQKEYEFIHTESLDKFRSSALMPNMKIYAIKMNGELVAYDNPDLLEAVDSLQSYRFKKVLGPYFWSPKITDLISL